MKRIHKVILAICLVLVMLVISAIVFIAIKTQPNKDTTMACFTKQYKCFRSEVADTAAERTLGLMFRKEIPEDKGMLFRYDEPGIYSFWMKNTYIPLDMIWINNHDVVHIEHASPCLEGECRLYTPKYPADYVLEINSGLAEKYNITVGDKVAIGSD